MPYKTISILIELFLIVLQYSIQCITVYYSKYYTQFIYSMLFLRMIHTQMFTLYKVHLLKLFDSLSSEI